MSVLTNTITTSTNNDTSIPIFENGSFNNNDDAPIIDNGVSVSVSNDDRNDEERVDLSNVKVPVFRFKLATTVFDNIREFARIHQHEDRVTFKDSWKTWCDNNKTMIDDETKRLSDIGFDNNINDKLFRTAKYTLLKRHLKIIPLILIHPNLFLQLFLPESSIHHLHETADQSLVRKQQVMPII